MPVAVALGWVNEAANAGGSFQRIVQARATPIAGGGTREESYLPFEGGLFRSGKLKLRAQATPRLGGLEGGGGTEHAQVVEGLGDNLQAGRYA